MARFATYYRLQRQLDLVVLDLAIPGHHILTALSDPSLKLMSKFLKEKEPYYMLHSSNLYICKIFKSRMTIFLSQTDVGWGKEEGLI